MDNLPGNRLFGQFCGWFRQEDPEASVSALVFHYPARAAN
jgi:hypothetical protein